MAFHWLSSQTHSFRGHDHISWASGILRCWQPLGRLGKSLKGVVKVLAEERLGILKLGDSASGPECLDCAVILQRRTYVWSNEDRNSHGCRPGL